MAEQKRFNRLKDKDRYYKLMMKKKERISNPDEKSVLDFTLTFTNKEILKIQTKSRIIKAKYGINRADILREVLLNLDDEALICFLGLYDINKIKKE